MKINYWIIPGLQYTPALNLRELFLTVCETCELNPDDVLGKNRHSEFARARQIFCYIARTMHKYKIQEIGNIIQQNHATVLHSVTVIENDISANYPPVIEIFKRLRIDVKNFCA